MSLSLKNKVVFITGASSGFGKACAEQFAQAGARLVLCARRIERLREIEAKLKAEHQAEILSLALDVQDKEAVLTLVAGLKAPWNDIDILVNNAGLALGVERIQDGKIDNWEQIIQTNVLGLLYVTRAIVPSMVKRNQGHIVNIGSVAGQDCYPLGNIYAASKHAVRAISKSLRLDLLGKDIRVTEIAPGAAHTEFSEVRWNSKEMGDKLYEGFKPLVADDIADAVLYCVTRPMHVNVAEMVIYPVAQASVNHICKDGQMPKGILEK